MYAVPFFDNIRDIVEVNVSKSVRFLFTDVHVFKSQHFFINIYHAFTVIDLAEIDVLWLRFGELMPLFEESG